MKIFVSGASGQLGKSFVHELNKRNIEFIAPPQEDFDITNYYKINKFITPFRPDIIINCASYNNVEEAEKNTTRAIDVNYKGVRNLVKISQLYNIKLVHFSTDYVFDGRKNSSYVETDIPNPLNLYGKSKLAGENEVMIYDNSLVFRLGWVIGYGKNNFLYKFTKWIQDEFVVKVSNDEISVPTFTFDIVKYVLMALDKKLTGLYHLTNSGKASRYELADKYAKLMGFANEIVPAPMATFKTIVKRPLVIVMSNQKISEVLGVNIPRWEESLKIYCNAIRSNPDLRF
ncbi:MAG: NAD(P)-dependent oxidoreductase [Endomicrobiaceae bacterium]|nr:NAD(P)-dependent oxidoreductase [Endomicrobiaceae bacterium]